MSDEEGPAGVRKDAPSDTSSPLYTDRLRRLESARWKQWLQVQAPYRWNVRRLCEGRVLELGCGIGRNLAHLSGRAVGVDHSASSVAVARSRGWEAFTPGEFRARSAQRSWQFDTILLAHVLEHLSETEADELITTYLPHLHHGGRLVLITPQEAGWSTDPSHVRWVGPDELTSTSRRLGLEERAAGSFPFPRPAGRVFRYNEFYSVAVRTGPPAHPASSRADVVAEEGNRPRPRSS